jgi:hypothetical protein
MYLKWCESNNFSAEVIEISPGEVAGIKSATIHVAGEFAYGWLRTETAFIDWSENHHLILGTEGILHLLQFLSRLKLKMILTLRLTHLICASMFIVPVALVVNTLIPQSQQFGSPTCQRERLFNARTTGLNTRTRPLQ